VNVVRHDTPPEKHVRVAIAGKQCILDDARVTVVFEPTASIAVIEPFFQPSPSFNFALWLWQVRNFVGNSLNGRLWKRVR
jgi:hypothetical protein